MAGFIDIACNFTHESFKNNLDTVIANAENVGVEKFVLLSASLKDLDPIQMIKSKSPEKYFICSGIHPHHADEIKDINQNKLLEKLRSTRPNAIGETGLDYFRNISPPNIQRDAFKIQIDIAKELELPLYLHQRDAHDDFIKIIKQNIKDHKDLFGRNIYYKKENLNNSFPEYILKNKKSLKKWIL